MKKEFSIFTSEFSIVLEPHGHPGSVLVTEGMLLARIGSLIHPKNNCWVLTKCFSKALRIQRSLPCRNRNLQGRKRDNKYINVYYVKRC